MSELLRAVLDDKCTFSAPAFYTILIPPISDASAAFRIMGGRLQCKSDRYFLQTGIMAFAVTGAAVYQDINQRLLTLFNANNQKVFFDNSSAMQSIMAGRTVTDYMTFPEYILWEPNETIGVTVESQSLNATYQSYVVLGGIEYAR